MSDVNDGPGAEVPPDGPMQWLDADALVAVMRRFASLLDLRRGLLDDLNVFPVPDGDTGTNMASTVHAVCAVLNDAMAQTAGAGPPTTEMERICRAIAHESLMGARGNSGVILSQILRGVAHTVGNAGRADATVLAKALVAGASGAYASVGRPVEGTILTVAREAAEAATAASGVGAGLSAVVHTARDAALGAVARSPQMLPVLADAGVVDAGGAGLALLFDAAVDVVDRRMGGAPAVDGTAVDGAAADDRWSTAVGQVPTGGPVGGRSNVTAGNTAGGVVADQATGGAYEVMFLLRSDAFDVARVDVMRRAWDDIGDSVVIVGGADPGGGGLWNCHIHTDDIGAAIEAALEVGRPRDIRVTDLAAQMAASASCAATSDDASRSALPAGATAVVAVANGSGVIEMMRALGATQVVVGGQGANPSTSQLVRAVQACGAASVVLLPDNPNIVAVANQVSAALEGTGPQVVVVPTRSVVAGLAALAAFDPDLGAVDNLPAMCDAADVVVAAEVTVAMRASHCEAGPIAAGDWLGITDGDVVVVGTDVVAVVTGLVSRVVHDHHELVTVLVGADAAADVTASIVGMLGDVHPHLDVEVHHGGQPLYPYLIGIE
jgi:uncharacterized protein